MRKYLPQCNIVGPRLYSAQGAETVRDVAQNMPRIYAVMSNLQENHQEMVIEMEGRLCDQSILILIYLGSNYSYISLTMVEKCNLRKEAHQELQILQLATETKRRVEYIMR